MSNDTPTVSVVIPTYNRCHYLQQAIQSVLAQSHSNLEVIVVDDGSVDDTSRIVDGFDDPRVRYLYQANAGRSAARNRGMAAAKGIYLAFLDDDDLFLPHKLAREVHFLEAHPDVDLVSAGVQYIDEQGTVKGVWRSWTDQPQLTLLRCLYGCPLIPSAVLLRREIPDRLDHWFDPELEPSEDMDFFLRLLHAGCRMGWLQEIVGAYRIHSASSQWDGARYSHAYLRMLDKLFALADLPVEVLVERARVYAHHHLTGACHAYAAGQVASAQQDLVQSMTLRATLPEGFPSPLALRVAGFADSFRVTDSRAYINYVFDQLPAPLVHLRRRRSEALGTFYMGRVFRAHEAGERPLLRDWLLGVCYAPRWLCNRGVWSILARDILGLSFSAR